MKTTCAVNVPSKAELAIAGYNWMREEWKIPEYDLNQHFHIEAYNHAFNVMVQKCDVNCWELMGDIPTDEAKKLKIPVLWARAPAYKPVTEPLP